MTIVLEQLLVAVDPNVRDTTITELHDKVLAYAQECHPDEFDDWMERMASLGIKASIRRIQARRRKGRVLQLRRERLDSAVAAVENGASTSDVFPPIRSLFDERVAIEQPDREPIRRRLGDMVDEDCFAVATMHGEHERSNRFERVFWEKVGQQIGERRIRDVFTEEQYLSLRKEVVGIS